MVAISLTHDGAKEMANRLRQFLADGGTSIKQTHAYEALAKTLGYRDWNTLLGVMQAVEQPAHDAPKLTTLLLIDRHAMAGHGVTLAQIETAFRREFPALLETRTRWESLCHEQLPARESPSFRPPVISVSLRAPEKAHVHDAVMEQVTAVAEPKWTFGEHGRDGALKLTFVFFPERDVDVLLPALREGLSKLPGDVTVLAVEKVDPPESSIYGKWRTDGVSYFVWAWHDLQLLQPDARLLAGMALKFNGDTLIRLRDVAALHTGVRDVRG